MSHGQHKARLSLRSRSHLANADVLRDSLKQAAATSDQTLHRGHNGFGEIYELRFPLTTAQGTATVLSAWIIRDGEDFPTGNLLYSLRR